MGNKRTVKAPRTGNFKIFFPLGIFQGISPVFCLFCERYTANKYFTCKYKPPLNFKNDFVNWPICLWCIFYSSISAPTFLSKCPAVLETDSRDVCALLLEGCCSKRRMSCEQRWHFTSQGYLFLFPEVKRRDFILFFCLVRKKILFISSEVHSCSLRRRDSKNIFCIFMPPSPATCKPWALKVTAVPEYKRFLFSKSVPWNHWGVDICLFPCLILKREVQW